MYDFFSFNLFTAKDEFDKKKLKDLRIQNRQTKHKRVTIRVKALDEHTSNGSIS